MEPPDLRRRLYAILDNAHDGAYGSTAETVDVLMEAIRREAIVGFGNPGHPSTVHPLDERTVSVWTFARPTAPRDPYAADVPPVVTIGGVAVPGVAEVAVCTEPVLPKVSASPRFVSSRPSFVEVVMRIRADDAARVFDGGVYAWITRHAPSTRVPYVDRAAASSGRL